jgi:hypothetical protein
LKDFEPSTELATSLLSPSLNPTPIETAMEEYLWQLCDYGWLTNSARQSSIPNETSSPGSLIHPPTLPIDEDVSASTHSPDFETLLEGALSFDFGMLNQVTNRDSTSGLYNG